MPKNKNNLLLPEKELKSQLKISSENQTQVSDVKTLVVKGVNSIIQSLS